MKQNKRKRTIKRSLLSSAILGALGSAQAATINVTGACNLVDAIEAANTDAVVGSCTAGSGADVIQVVTANSSITISTIFEPASGAPGSVGLPMIDSNITLEGNGLTVNGNNIADNFRLFHVQSTGDLTLRDTTVTNADDGYGIGSGLFSEGRVTIENSTFVGNNSALFLVDGYGNEINNSVIRHNTNTSNYSAGLQTYFVGLSINNSSFFDNQHGNNSNRGGPNLSGAASLFQSDVTISNSTISGNKSVYGAGIIVNSVPPPPVPPTYGRFTDSPMRGVVTSQTTITNSTISQNESYIASGILQFGYDSYLTLQGSIVAGNVIRGSGYAENGYLFNPGGVTVDANNIIGDGGESKFSGLILGASDSSFSGYAEDNLYPLSLTNGQFVHPLHDGSVAIDGNDVSCFGSLFDQEGKARGIDGDDNGSFICDIGAFEHSLVIEADGAPCTLSNAILSANTNSSVGGCQTGNGHDIISLPVDSVQNQAVPQYYLIGNPNLGFGLPAIETAITIEGNGSTIARDPGAVDNFDVVAVGNGGQLNLMDTQISGANGGVSAITTFYGNVNLVNSTISGNDSGGMADLVSINSSVLNSTFENNQQISGVYSGNYGVLSSVQSIGFELQSSTISNNQLYLAALDLRYTSMNFVENATISGNTAQLVGGLFISNNNGLPSKISHTTITGNEGSFTGGIYATIIAPDQASISNSIISGNTQVAPSPVTPTSSSQPSGRLIQNPAWEGIGAGTITNIAGPTTPHEINSNTPYLTLDDNNIIGQNGDPGVVGAILGASDVTPMGPTSAVIDSLADNGGLTQNHEPVAGGLAVDGSTFFSCRAGTDQNNRIRPWDGDGNGSEVCDVGAVEFGSITESDLIFKDGFDPTIIIRRTFAKE